MSVVSTARAAEQAARERAVEDAIHSGEMEGLSVSHAFESDAAEYARGAIDVDEFGRRVRARNGVA
ncbi:MULTISPECIES: antitoxin VbhA family protein [unclassified Cryobacterium]|uniref:antitoxin VbhA family protein n=1 Tax=unclassified Cryobacterium TaxID=2649013 RepID=UPI000CE468BC|nr:MULTISPECIES: antitoxin VbhA family protein [unclassified Cryobacterium]